MRRDGSFLRHKLLIKVEGFDLERLLSQCMASGIRLRKVRFQGDLVLKAEMMEEDRRRFFRLAKNRYHVTILKEDGYKPLFLRLLARKSTVLGLILCGLILYYQNAFVSEIRIYGYQRIQESTIRQALSEVGLYEGCSKKLDITYIENTMYASLDNISWIGIEYNGSLAEVTIVEGAVTPEPIDIYQPCHIVAAKDGYIEEVIAKEGMVVKEKGASVQKGDVVISGILPINDTSYTREGEGHVRTVHAIGDVKARIIYRLKYYQETTEIVKEETGKNFYGVSVTFGDFSWNSAKEFWMYDSSVYTEKTVFQFLRPIPVNLSLTKVSEVELSKRERTEEEIQTMAETQSRHAIKENIPENTQILNNSLMFSVKENIIEVSIMLHALEEIGMEQSFYYNEAAEPEEKEAEGGTVSLGKQTNGRS